jgi:hypothetical protein
VSNRSERHAAYLLLDFRLRRAIAVTLNSSPPIASATGISVAMPTEQPLFFFGSGGATSAEAMLALSSQLNAPTIDNTLTFDAFVM